MKRYFFILFLLLTIGIVSLQAQALISISSSRMGSGFVYTAAGTDSTLLDHHLRMADREVARIEQLISSWIPGSQTSWVNDAAGREAVVVDEELYQLLYRSLKISRLTGGAFDPTYAGMTKVWRFDGTMTELPDSASIMAAVSNVDYRKIKLDPEQKSIFLQDTGMKIGFGGIGKGYAADRARHLLEEAGVASGVVNAGGDLMCWGNQPDGSPWQISIADPVHPDRIVAAVSVSNMAVVTSGNYERFAEIDGVRYAHILDPRSGWPVTGIRSVTVFAPIAEFADALATSIFVLGEQEGLILVEQLQGVECLIITDDNRMITSPGLRLLPVSSGEGGEEYLFRVNGESR